MKTFHDDLGHPVMLAAPPRRIVSLVPSLTEALEATLPGVVIGATDYCIKPPELDVTRVRGTKNPNLEAIKALQPELVVANQEENRRIDVERMREAGLTVWVTKIDSVEEAFASLTKLFGEVLETQPAWLSQAKEIWAVPPHLEATAALPIWRDPWIVVGGNTFSADLLARVGVRNYFEDQSRYPNVELDELRQAPLVLLPNEPYNFTEIDGPECFEKSVLIDGRATAWYGPAMVWSRSYLEEAITTG